MSIEDMELVKEFLRAVESGGEFTKELFEQCYFNDLAQRGVSEKPEVSKLWIEHYWSGLNSVGLERLRRARTNEKLAELLAGALGK